MSAAIAPRLRLAALAAVVLAATATASAESASAEFGIVPGSFVAKTHAPVPLQVTSGTGLPQQRAVDVAAIAASPPLTGAGAHPDATASFDFKLTGIIPDDSVRDAVVNTPPGFLGNSEAVPACSREAFAETFRSSVSSAPHPDGCPPASQVGVATVLLAPSIWPRNTAPVYRIATAPGRPASFGFGVGAQGIVFNPVLRSDGDYGLSVSATDIAGKPFGVGRSAITLWGVPADPIHDSERWDPTTPSWGAPSDVPIRPFLINPTSCDSGPLPTRLSIRSWQDPGTWLPADPADPDYVDVSPEPTDCDQLSFGGPSAPVELTMQPAARVAGSPSGYETTLTLPYSDDPDSLANPTLRDATVRLPADVVANPAAARGLGACSSAQIGLRGTDFPEPHPNRFTDESPACPSSSKIGAVEVATPLLDEPLRGAVYQAAQGDNPFGSLLAIYIAIDDKRRGLTIKLAGEVTPDPDTGQLTATFSDNPQLPFTRLDLSFFGGENAVLVNPRTCGEAITRGESTPWSAPHSGPPAELADGFAVEGDCPPTLAERPFDPGFTAGTVNPIAGSTSPFAARFTRSDGEQEFDRVELTVPEGLTARLAGIPYCSEAQISAARANDGTAEQADPSCPAASRVGTTAIGAGAGSSPLYVGGGVYLAGPYKGAPLSLAFVVPAVAGPFDLGVQVVRAALRVNPVTAQITAVSDEIPKILEGVPLRVRDIRVAIDREGFSLNPTSCAEMGVSGIVSGSHGAAAEVSNRFQVGDCAALGFRPRTYLRLYGKRFTRSANPRLRAVVVPRPGDANIARTAVKMPNSILLDQDNIRTVCTRAQFATDTCPERSIYGRAAAVTPLLDQPLRGPVYLRSSDNPLPDLVADLRGQVRVELAGRTDSVRGALRNTFDIVPDAPVSKFVLLLQGGQKSLLVANRNLCRGPQLARVNMVGQNGRRHLVRQRINIPCRRAAKRRQARRQAAKHRAARSAGLSRARQAR